MTIKSQRETEKEIEADKIDAVIGGNMQPNLLDRLAHIKKAIVSAIGLLTVTVVGAGEIAITVITAIVAIATVVGVYLASNDDFYE